MNRNHHWNNNYNLLIYDELDSTNDEAKRLAYNNTKEEFIIIAGSQTKGRGRYGKKWLSSTGNLYLSLLIRPKIAAKLAHEYSFITIISLGEALKFLFPLAKMNISYKWPNDLLLNDKKLAGILLESKFTGNNLDWLIIGMGVNIASIPQIDNVNITSLAQEKYYTTIEQVLDRFMLSFNSWQDIWLHQGFERIREAWLKQAKGLGSSISFSTIKGQVEGIFQDIDKNGSLQIKIASGEVITVSTGEVFFS